MSIEDMSLRLNGLLKLAGQRYPHGVITVAKTS
jgi:hypothetical protein